MDASESPPNSSQRHHHHPRNTHAAAPHRINPDTNTTNAPNTPDTTPSITHLRHFATFPNRHHQHATTHRSVRRVSSNDIPGLGARNSLAEALSPVQLQVLQLQQQQQTIATGSPFPLLPTTIVNPAPASPRFNFAAFWNPQRFFSAIRPASTPPLPLPSPPASSSTTSSSSPSSSGTVSRMVTSGDREGDSPTPTPSTISKSSSSSSMRSLVAQGESLSQGHRGGPRMSSLSVKPVSATTTVTLSLPPSSDPTSSSSGRWCHHQDVSRNRSQQSLASVPARFNALSISKSDSNSSDLDISFGGKSTHISGSSNNGLDSSSCYPSPTSPDSSSTVAIAALERIQKRIAQSQSQLVQYIDMIQKHETDRTGYAALQASQQKRREVLEREIEFLESAIRQGPSTPVSPLSTFFSSANLIFGHGGGDGSTPGHAVTRRSPPSIFSWSSPPSSYEDSQDCHQGQDTPCCSFNATSTRINPSTSFSAPTPITTTPITTTTSNVTPTTAFPRRSSTSTLSTLHNQSLSYFSPYSPSSSSPFAPSGPTRSRSTSSLHVTFSASGSSSSLSSPAKSYVSCHQLQPIPSTQPPHPPPLSSPSTPSKSSPAATEVPLQKCRRCSQKSTLTERRDQLRNAQRNIDQVQQKIHSTNSQIRHLQRTFVLPIETCLQEDKEELGRLQQLQMLQSQRERQQQQQHQQQLGSGGGGSRPSSGSNSSASGGGGR